MKLLRTDSLEVVEFSPDVIPKYAILSHTWGRQEITWTDLRARTSAGLVHSSVKKKEGYAKVCRSADVAARDGYHYIWIDSCCIDKTNHAELQEAINSMYKWYERSDVCYVYFEDFDIDNDLETREVDDELKSCRWFTRGWTLQELVAPRKRKHFDLNWACIDDAVSKIDLARTIEERTGVPQHILGNRQSLASINVASKMRWAAGRRTTRPEDMAYSLFGIFNVNLQTCYGEEGLAAFIRLQDAIIRQSADETIFAW
ncbi:heterokaryon incompatibility protein-domain-containing protein, partial [Xylariales sp. PMI_506]